MNQPSCSNLCSAGYKEPSLTCSTSPEIWRRRWLTDQPFRGSRAKILSSSKSKVPWTRSEGLLTISPRLPSQGIAVSLGKQEEMVSASAKGRPNTGHRVVSDRWPPLLSTFVVKRPHSKNRHATCKPFRGVDVLHAGCRGPTPRGADDQPLPEPHRAAAGD